MPGIGKGDVAGGRWPGGNHIAHSIKVSQIGRVGNQLYHIILRAVAQWVHMAGVQGFTDGRAITKIPVILHALALARQVGKAYRLALAAVFCLKVGHNQIKLWGYAGFIYRGSGLYSYINGAPHKGL